MKKRNRTNSRIKIGLELDNLVLYDSTRKMNCITKPYPTFQSTALVYRFIAKEHKKTVRFSCIF